ncbi:YhjD/YihY/BrkB family envelope integrity protein [Thermodesulfobacteriota bacterium]
MVAKENDSYFKLIWRHFQVFLQKINLSVDLFVKNELFNHAGAAAFFFLLSLPPLFLLLIIAFDRYLSSYPEASAVFFEFMKNIHENLDKDFLIKIGLLNVSTAAIGLLGLLNLAWAGRAILTAIQRGLGVIFPAEKFRPPVITNIFSLVILSILFLASILITFISVGFNFVQNILSGNIIVQTFFQSLLPLIRRSLPLFIIVLLIFLAYRFVPAKRPKTSSSLVGALGCAFSIFLVHILFSKFFTVTRYSVIYGVLGSVILMVLWVYFSFVLFFFFAEYTLVTDKLEVLVLERMYLFRMKPDNKGKRVEKFLFSHPKRIFEKYARRYEPGEILFNEGEKSTDIYFVDRGSVDIFRKIEDRNHKIATIPEGGVFGEMAYLLNESRTATAIAATESILLILTPDIFEDLLKSSTTFSRDVIQVLCDRLSKTAFLIKP